MILLTLAVIHTHKIVNAYITQRMVRGGIVLIFIKHRISYSLHQAAKRHNTF